MTSTYANTHYLAEPDWLIAHLADDDLRVIDARFDVRARADGKFDEVSGRADYAAGHIPRARFVDLKSDLTEPQDPTSIIGPEAFSTLMSRLGIGPRSTVVIYDDRGGIWAARLWWALRYYGHDDAKILNGGLSAWHAAGGDLQVEVSTPSPAQFVASVREHLRATKEDVLTAIAPDHTVITYCGGGVFASFALFVLVLMGHEKAALYDASWLEWGCDDSLPVETDCPTT